MYSRWTTARVAVLFAALPSVALAFAGTAVVVSAFLVAVAVPAGACVSVVPLTVTDALGTDVNPDLGFDDLLPAVGVYEVKPIASIPNLVIRNSEAVRKVSRYWGVQPERVDEQERWGGEWLLGGTGSCGRPDPDRVTYTVLINSDGVIFTHPMSARASVLTPADEQALTAHFGPPVLTDVGNGERVAAIASLWWSRITAFVLLTAGAGLLLIGVRKARSRQPKANNVQPEIQNTRT